MYNNNKMQQGGEECFQELVIYLIPNDEKIYKVRKGS